ncbi:hypothetical protein OOT00_04810 [Desulfobotulus sp. H1]|uniref:Lipoprotein n=1 Tax=Desulfobotulus pelophilus TaxID=2823377 RepID=A0ABT3N779_9BACT|nr:hypothetical protein [Desulfobotulus pelophilus]MCW7753305.1 hypothetical protein [Desulfobotulus pelophilus]
MMQKTIPLLLMTILSMGCTHHSTPAGPKGNDARPAFIYNPSVNGQIGGVGIARPHLHGPNAQRNLAISRAIDEIARQKGTQVQSWHAVQTTGTRDSATTHMDSVSIQTTSGETIHAVIRQMWHDPANSELYIWMLTH